MARLASPFSGDVMQAFRFLTSSMSTVGSQFGFINVYNTNSKAPEVEQEVVDTVGSYGSQLGRISDALAVLVARLPQETLSETERKAVVAFQAMVDEVNDVKERHGRRALRF